MTLGLSVLLCQKPVTLHSFNPQNQPKVLAFLTLATIVTPGPLTRPLCNPVYVNETEIIKQKTANTGGGASCSPSPLPSVLPETWNLHRELDIRMGPFFSPLGFPSHHFPISLCAPRSEPFVLEYPLGDLCSHTSFCLPYLLVQNPFSCLFSLCVFRTENRVYHKEN